MCHYGNHPGSINCLLISLCVKRWNVKSFVGIDGGIKTAAIQPRRSCYCAGSWRGLGGTCSLKNCICSFTTVNSGNSYRINVKCLLPQLIGHLLR